MTARNTLQGLMTDDRHRKDEY